MNVRIGVTNIMVTLSRRNLRDLDGDHYGNVPSDAPPRDERIEELARALDATTVYLDPER